MGKLAINDARLIDLTPHSDSRGVFCKLYSQQDFLIQSTNSSIAQVNHSYTAKKGTIRGMHYQLPPYQEVKMVRCLKGVVFDVLVDLRVNSPTFKHWSGTYLSSVTPQLLVIPEGCAHGFQTIEDDTELLYFHTSEYSKDLERGMYYQDEDISIDWPLEVTEVSTRDRCLPTFNKIDIFGCGASEYEL